MASNEKHKAPGLTVSAGRCELNVAKKETDFWLCNNFPFLGWGLGRFFKLFYVYILLKGQTMMKN